MARLFFFFIYNLSWGEGWDMWRCGVQIYGDASVLIQQDKLLALYHKLKLRVSVCTGVYMIGRGTRVIGCVVQVRVISC